MIFIRILSEWKKGIDNIIPVGNALFSTEERILMNDTLM